MSNEILPVETPSAKPPFSVRHPYWNLVIVAFNNLFGIITFIGLESVFRFDMGPLLAYAIIVGIPLSLISYRNPFEKKPKGLKFIRIVAVFLCGFAIWFAVIGFVAGFLRPVTISKETTYFTEPVEPSGWIDYAAAVDKRCSPPVPPEKNGFRDLVAAFGKGIVNENIEDPDWKTLCDKLRIAPGVKPRFRLESPKDIVDNATLGDIRTRPWKRAEHPDFAGWLDDQKPRFDLLAESVRKEHFVLPLIPLRRDITNRMVFDPTIFLLYGAYSLQDLAQWLYYRITLHLGEDKETEALDDLETLYRLATALRTNVGDFHPLYAAWSLEASANELSLIWLWTAKPDEKKIAAWEARRSPLIRSISRTELVFLQRIQSLNFLSRCGDAEYVFDKNDPDFYWKAFNLRLLRFGPWDRHFRDLNRYFDDYERIVQQPGRQSAPPFSGMIAEALGSDKTTADYIWIAVKTYVWKGTLGAYIALMSEFGSRFLLMSDYGEDLFFDYYPLSSDIRTETAYALERFRLSKGQYPQSLEELRDAGFMVKLPEDPFSRDAAPLHYRTEKDGDYTLYSVGRNGVDDDGLVFSIDGDKPGGENVPKTADDLRTRPKR